MRVKGNGSRPLFRDENAAKRLYEKRYPEYRAAADLTIKSERGILETVSDIEKGLGI